MQRRRSSVARHFTRPVYALSIAVGLVVGGAGTADAADSSSLGPRFNDGLDTRYSASSFASAAASAGYISREYTNGRHVDDVWNSGLTDAVLGLFGHANAGIFQTQEGPTDPQDSILAAGSTTDLISPYRDIRFLSEYLPYTDVDDMRLLILGGCDTARSGPWGDFNKVAVSRGIDSVITFQDLVYFPATAPGTAIGSTNYSGNYFWSRFSTYVAGGTNAGTALAWARTDLVAKEGSAGGWDRYVIRGAVSNPAAVVLKPAAPGQPWNSQPLATETFQTFSALTPTGSTVSSGPDGTSLTTVSTVEGVEYRTGPDGAVYDAVGTAASTGEVTLSAAQARAAAYRFASDNVAGFSADWALVTDEPVSHLAGDTVQLLRWRPLMAGHAAAREITIEIDRRTGAVVYFSATRAKSSNIHVAITAAEAIAKARDAIGSQDGHATAAADIWNTSRWTITIDRGLTGRPEARVPDVEQIEIDARTGDVLARTST